MSRAAMGGAPGDALSPARARLVVLGFALIYAAGHMAWYGATPMGAFPVLDGREILDLALAIAHQQLPPEPFYRAPLYPASLAVLVAAGWPEGGLADAARLLNLIAHLGSTLLVFELARRVWDRTAAGVLAGLLFGLYPVLLHYAGDPYDVTLATALALAATLAAWNSIDRGQAGAALLAGTCLALAVLCRPHFLPCALALPALLGWLARTRRVRLAVAAGCGLLLVFAAMALANRAVGGEWRWLPWQGSHAIWDGNGSGADGLAYRHSIPIPDLGPGVNPARHEAETVYCGERDCSKGIDLDEFARYWRDRTLQHIRANPGAWLALMGDKLYYLVNQFEQYNNKTYWVHKERSPWLRWNPLGWAVLLALAAGAAWLPMQPGARRLLLSLAAVYALGLLLYFVSGRFRVSLAGWSCVLAGGWVLGAASWREPALRRRWLGAGITTAVLALVSAWPVRPEIRDRTIAEDWTLLADAALAAGDWRQGEDWAQRVLRGQPDRNQSYTQVCVARLLAWERDVAERLPPAAWLGDSLRFCDIGAIGSDRAAYRRGFFLVALCRRQEAGEAWRRLWNSRLVGSLARSASRALEGAAAVPGGGEEALDAMRAANRSTLPPGARSILAALEGGHCVAPAGAPDSPPPSAS